MACPCWRDWSETSNVLFVNKPIVRVVAFCRFEDHLNPATRDVDLEIALSGSFHPRLFGHSNAEQGDEGRACSQLPKSPRTRQPIVPDQVVAERALRLPAA